MIPDTESGSTAVDINKETYNLKSVLHFLPLDLICFATVELPSCIEPL